MIRKFVSSIDQVIVNVRSGFPKRERCLLSGLLAVGIGMTGVAFYNCLGDPVHPSMREYRNPRVPFYYPNPGAPIGSAQICDENGDDLADAIVSEGEAIFYTDDWNGRKADIGMRMSSEMRDEVSAVMIKGRKLGESITQHFYDEYMKKYVKGELSFLDR